jgi:signal transduction histidine kinase
MARRAVALSLLAIAAFALVVAGVTQARARPELAVAGGDAGASVVQLVAGALLALGAVECARRGEAALAAAIVVACGGLGLHALPAPPDRALIFTLALAGAGVAPAAAAHAALLHPGGRPAGAVDRVAAGSGYAIHAGVGGLLVALVFDPQRAGCFTCPVNLLLVHGDPALADWLGRSAPRAMAVTECALAALVAIRLARRAPAARSLAAPVSAAAIAVLALAAVANLRAASGLAGKTTDGDLALATAAALGLLAAGLAWRPLRAARLRAALGRLTVAASGSVEEVRAELARALGDPKLAFVVPHPETGAPIALDGMPAPSAPPGRARTPVERRGRIVAWLEHREDLRAAPEVSAAALALEREALHAARRLQEEEVRTSTQRLIAAGEAERRRLERDLHDGAQQRLLALGLALERTRAHAAPEEAAALAEASARVTALRTDVRRLAHGIHSVTLAEGGLAEAVLRLVAETDGRATVESLPRERAAADAEAAVHRLVGAALHTARGAPLRLRITLADGVLEASIRIEAPVAALREALAHAGARIEAAGGTLAVDEGGSVLARVPVGVHPGPAR